MAVAAITGLLALMLIMALFGGTAAERLRMPRLVGWLVAGIALKWALVGLDAVGSDAAGALLHASPESLKFVKRLSLTAIMFTVGMAFELHHLRRLGKAFVWITLGQSVAVGVLTFACTFAAASLAGSDDAFLMAAFLAVFAIGISPDATLLTLRQYSAKGHSTDTVLTVTGLSAVVAILLLNLLMIIFGQTGLMELQGGRIDIWSAIGRFLAATGGSVLAGVGAGLVLALLHGQLAVQRESKALLAVLLGVLALATPTTLGLDYLLTSLVAGVTFINFAQDPGRMESRLAVVGVPLFALLFVVAGFKLRLSGLTSVAILVPTIAYIAANTIGKIGGTYLVLRRPGVDAELRPMLGLGLLCHAGLAMGLLGGLEIVAAKSEWLKQTAAVVLAAVAVFEVAGPLLLKRTVVRAGEVRAFRLFHLPKATLGGWGRLRDGAASLLRRMGVMGMPGESGGPILARHVMHMNVKVIDAGAGLDEVLHFIERSRLDHFPVVDADGRFIGTINLADVRDIIYDPVLRELVDAQDLLEVEQATASPDETLEELFEKFRRHKARDLVVLDESSGRILGVVEQRDVLRAMHVQETGQDASSASH